MVPCTASQDGPNTRTKYKRYTVRICYPGAPLPSPIVTPVILVAQRAGSICAPHVNALHIPSGSVLRPPRVRHLGAFALAWNRALPLCETVQGRAWAFWASVLSLENEIRWEI